MGRVINALDSKKRCTICRHFYWRPKGKSEQLPLYTTKNGPMCQRCISEILWLDFRHNGRDRARDPVAYLAEPTS